jgi:hypothetical protein
MFDCIVTLTPDYRRLVTEEIPQLDLLDGLQATMYLFGHERTHLIGCVDLPSKVQERLGKAVFIVSGHEHHHQR